MTLKHMKKKSFLSFIGTLNKTKSQLDKEKEQQLHLQCKNEAVQTFGLRQQESRKVMQ